LEKTGGFFTPEPEIRARESGGRVGVGRRREDSQVQGNKVVFPQSQSLPGAGYRQIL
jgi:hypothetical protein